jgi:tRNA (guanine-N7-)-methyltransferase
VKAKDLKNPFSFAERHPYLEDGVFYVPAYQSVYEKVFPPFVELFGNSQPVCVEYCSGNGDWVVQQALEKAEINWIAVEKRFDRVRKIWAKIKNRGLKNVLVVCGEAFTFTHHYLAPLTLSGVFIHFPDPWPKGRHAKHRLLKVNFIDELARALCCEKEVTFVTDDKPYLNETLHLLGSHPCFKPIFPESYYQKESANYGGSWFENFWREKGRSIYSTRWIKYAHPH